MAHRLQRFPEEFQTILHSKRETRCENESFVCIEGRMFRKCNGNESLEMLNLN